MQALFICNRHRRPVADRCQVWTTTSRLYGRRSEECSKKTDWLAPAHQGYCQWKYQRNWVKYHVTHWSKICWYLRICLIYFDKVFSYHWFIAFGTSNDSGFARAYYRVPKKVLKIWNQIKIKMDEGESSKSLKEKKKNLQDFLFEKYR